MQQIEKSFQKYSGIYDVSAFYESRNCEIYNKGFQEGMRGLPITGQKNVKFGIWGITSQSLELKNFILDACEGWEFHVIVDKTATGTFEGLEITRPEQIEDLDREIVYFVVPESAHDAARQLLGRIERKYILIKGWQMEYQS